METIPYLSKKGQALAWIILFVVLVAAVGILWISYGRTLPEINQNISSAAENTTINAARTGLLTMFDMTSIVFWIIAGAILIFAVIMLAKAGG